jgi:hypothetical protein
VCRTPLILLLITLTACGGSGPVAPVDPADEGPTTVDPPTPPPDTGVDNLLPQEPLPEGESAPTPVPTPPAAAAAPVVLGPISVDSAVLSERVTDRKPDGVGDTFRDGTEVFCFMKVSNPGPTRLLRHEWFYGGARKSSIEQKVKGPTWRTWSSRPVFGVGAWRVDVVDEEGTVLKSLPFTVR